MFSVSMQRHPGVVFGYTKLLKEPLICFKAIDCGRVSGLALQIPTHYDGQLEGWFQFDYADSLSAAPCTALALRSGLFQSTSILVITFLTPGRLRRRSEIYDATFLVFGKNTCP